MSGWITRKDAQSTVCGADSRGWNGVDGTALVCSNSTCGSEISTFVAENGAIARDTSRVGAALTIIDSMGQAGPNTSNTEDLSNSLGKEQNSDYHSAAHTTLKSIEMSGLRAKKAASWPTAAAGASSESKSRNLIFPGILRSLLVLTHIMRGHPEL